MKTYSKGSHTKYHHRFQIVWITKYRYKILRGALQRRVREIVVQVAEEFGIQIVSGVVSSDHVHIFVSIPPRVRESDLVKAMKGRSSRKVQQEFPELRKRYWTISL
jgi:putative transposase